MRAMDAELDAQYHNDRDAAYSDAFARHQDAWDKSDTAQILAENADSINDLLIADKVDHKQIGLIINAAMITRIAERAVYEVTA